jgi:roadblock/LC7 domain-containing protein
VFSLVNIDELFQLDGVIAVAQLDDMGRISDWKAKGVVDPEVKEHTSKLITDITAMFREFAREAPRNWSPTRALIYNGGDMTLIAAGTAAVTVETKKVNFEKLFKAFGILGYSK